MTYWARSENDSGQRQLLADHLRNVAITAGRFAEAAGLPREMGEWAGWLHDLGKYSDEFQRHLLAEDTTFVEHAAHGAAIAAAAGAIECAFAVAGHHTGLATRHKLQQLRSRDEATAGLQSGTRVWDRAERFAAVAREDAGIDGKPSRTVANAGDELRVELRTRMLLSCLVDADRLDAEAWGSRSRTDLRADVEALKPTARLTSVLNHIAALAAGHPESRVASVRREVLEASLTAADREPGFFSLTVPTGGGKTLASLAFALKHAAQYQKRRLVFVLPFLTIIEQNASVIREATGEGANNWGRVVLEHHSNVAGMDEPQGDADRELRRRLLAENWDVPIVVSTTVQFFESLFSDRPSSLRKVHNVARSVIVLDEAQTFPPGMLRPLVAMLRQLVDDHGCTVLFCTATQPALSNPIKGQSGQDALIPEGSIREIVNDPESLFRALKRVRVAWPSGREVSMQDVAADMSAVGQALAIMNTKKQASELYRALAVFDPSAIHLSTRLCAAHRTAVLTEVRRRLKASEPCVVSATQLVEAGVDIDFPAVWRVLGPLDGIAQAAGRCNREGKLTSGRVTVFRAVGGTLPRGAYHAATQVTDGLLRGGVTPDIDRPATFADYFVRLYNVRDLDESRVGVAREQFDFPAVAERFRLIDDATTAVIVPYAEGAEWAERALGDAEFGRRELRRLQLFTVGLFENELAAGQAAGEIVRTESGLHIFRGRYDPALGLVLAAGSLDD